MKRLVWVLLATWVAATASAQSLVDVAKKEKERRKEVDSSPSRTVTDVELRRAGGPRTTLPSANTSTSSAGDADDSNDADANAEDEEAATDERQTEAYWRGRLAPFDARITSMETRLQGAEFTSNPRGGPARQRLEQDLARAKTERQAVLDEARRKGAPPGWLR
jgi:hypothetical protein